MKSRYKRVLLKLSGEALLPKGSQFGVDVNSAATIASEIKPVIDAGVEIAIVIGGGNIFRGAHASKGGEIGQAQADSMGMLATVINGLAIQEALERAGISTRLMTSIPMANVGEPFIRRRALRHFEKGRVLILGGGTGNPFFSTDTAAALRALEVEADVILKGTKVDGVYSADPKKVKDAKRFDKLTFQEVLDKRLAVMDLTAMQMCMEHNLPVVVFDFFKAGNLAKASSGQNVGTVIYG